MLQGVLKIVGLCGIAAFAVFGYIAGDEPRQGELSAAESEQPILTGSDVIVYDWSTYNQQYPMENSYLVINQGAKVGDDCTFTVSGLRGLGNAPTVIRTVAFKPSTCEELLEVGNMSDKAL